jgi:hypothetical protein
VLRYAFDIDAPGSFQNSSCDNIKSIRIYHFQYEFWLNYNLRFTTIFQSKNPIQSPKLFTCINLILRFTKILKCCPTFQNANQFGPSIEDYFWIPIKQRFRLIQAHNFRE